MERPWTILLTHTTEDFSVNYETEALDALSALGEVRRNPLDQRLSSSDLLTYGRGCQIIVTEGKTAIDAGALHGLESLLAVIRVGVELRSIDVDTASAEGILVVNIPGEYVTPVVELTVGFMVCLARDVVNRAQALRAGQSPWSPMGTQLREHTLGIVGCGDIGRELVRVATALGMRVCFADPYVNSHPPAEKMELSQLLATSDYVSVHAKWTTETEDMFGEAEFRRMKPTAYFINTARGALVNEQALERALREGWIAGAALDVFRNEPTIIGNPLLELPNVIPTPHIAGFSPEYRWAQAWRTVEIVRELQAGKVPANTVNNSAVQSPRLAALRLA